MTIYDFMSDSPFLVFFILVIIAVIINNLTVMILDYLRWKHIRKSEVKDEGNKQP